MGYRNSKNKPDYGLEDFFQEVSNQEAAWRKISMKLGKITRTIKVKLEEMDRNNLENRKKAGYAKGTGVDRSRMSMTVALKNKLKERMKDFQEKLFKSVDAVMEIITTVEEIQERHDAVMEIEKRLLELQQIIADMATLVDAQGETLNDIENQVQNAVDHLQYGTEELRAAKRLQKKSRKCMFIAIIILLVIAEIVVLSILKPWAKYKIRETIDVTSIFVRTTSLNFQTLFHLICFQVLCCVIISLKQLHRNSHC